MAVATQEKPPAKMPEALATYRVRVSGLWSSRHEFRTVTGGEETPLGVVEVRRGRGMVVGGEWRPEKGEKYVFRRDPGLLRSQFSVWTEDREWLGSSLRWSFVRREIALSTGTKPFRLLPLPGLRRGWGLYAPKTGETVRIEVPLVGRDARISVFRKADLSLVLFTYFVACQLYPESLLPGPSAAQAVQG